MIETCPMCRQSKVVNLPCRHCQKTAHNRELKARGIKIIQKKPRRNNKGQFAKGMTNES